MLSIQEFRKEVRQMTDEELLAMKDQLSLSQMQTQLAEQRWDAVSKETARRSFIFRKEL